MSAAASFNEYLAAIGRDLQSGVSTEHTHRPALKRLIEAISGIQATNEPKRSACGAPDYDRFEMSVPFHGPRYFERDSWRLDSFAEEF